MCVHAQNTRAQIATPKGTTALKGLDIKCALGFGDLCDVTRPTSLSLLISNYTGQTLEGRLVLSDKWKGYKIELGNIYLSELQVRRFGTIQDLKDWGSAKLELWNLDDEVIWQQELLLKSHTFTNTVRNPVMIIEDGQRKVSFPEVKLLGIEEDEDLNKSRRFSRRTSPTQYLSTKLGTQVETINAETWQIPTHHAPLLPIRAIFFPASTNAGNINGGQWRAIAEWMCLGGRIFVDSNSTEVLQELLTASPLTDEPIFQEDSFSVRRIGAGAIYEYSEPMFQGDSSAAEKTIVSSVAKMTPHHLTEFVSVDSMSRMRRGTDRNRLYIIILLLFYTLLSGIGTLAFYRRTRKQVVIYLFTTVAVAGIGAGILGANLRYTKGDLGWITVSQLGAGGSTQIARAEARSSGARNSVLTMSGVEPNIQITSEDDRSYWMQHEVGSFSHQTNLLKDDSTFQTSVKITPWGRQRLYAVDFDPEMKPLGVELTIDADETLTLKVINNLSVDIKSARIILTATSDQDDSRLRFHQIVQLPTIAVGQEANIEAPLKLQQFSGSEAFSFESRLSLSPPVLNSPNAVGAWIFAQISKSPTLQLDESRSDFTAEHQHVHLLMQELRPEEIPAWSEFGL